MLYLIAILALGILVIIHEAGHFLVARLSGMRVDTFSVGFGPALWRAQRGETTYQVAAVPLGGFVQIAGLNPGDEIDPEDPRSYTNRPAWQRFATIAAGPFINYMFAVLLLITLNLTMGVPVLGNGAVVESLVKGRPAAAAGVLPGDEIVRINDKPITLFGQVAPLVDASQGKALQVEVLRGQEHKTVTVQPVQDDGKWRIGIALRPRDERRHLGAWEAVKTGFVEPAVRSWLTLKALYDSARGKQKAEFGSVIKIVDVMKERIGMGWVRGVEIVAIISTMLGFFNLLPIPALDGGRLVFLGWEIITRRPVSQRVEQVVHTIGMVVLLALIALLMFKDIRAKFVGG